MISRTEYLDAIYALGDASISRTLDWFRTKAVEIPDDIMDISYFEIAIGGLVSEHPWHKDKKYWPALIEHTYHRTAFDAFAKTNLITLDIDKSTEKVKQQFNEDILFSAMLQDVVRYVEYTIEIMKGRGDSLRQRLPNVRWRVPS